MTKLLKFCNENHQFLIGGILVIIALFWFYGCQSQVKSLIYPTTKVTRAELQNELNYLIGQAQARETSLDQQDAIKQAVIDAANIFATTGTFNPTGLLNMAISIGAISFGLNQRKKLIVSNTTKNTNST